LDDFERVFSLLISDKLKSCLPAGALNYVLSLEGNDWFDPRRIGELADTYVSNHTSAEKPKHVSSAYVGSNGSESPKTNAQNGGRFGHAFRAAKSQDSNKEVLCYNCQKKGHIARFCPQSNVVRQSSQTASRSPGNVRRCYRCHSTQHLARFCTKANNSGDRDGSEAQATVRACFSDVRIAPAASAFSRDYITGARVDGLTGVCAFSRDEASGAQVCIDGKSDEWKFGEFP